MIENNAGRRRGAGLVSGAAMVMVLAGSLSAQAQQPGPQLRLDHLARLADVATSTVDVTLDAAMLQSASGLLGQAPTSAMKELVAGLKGVYVRVFEFDKEGMYTTADVDAIRAQLTGSWRRYVSVREKGESVEIYAWQDGGVPGGLAIVVAEPRELTVVNIVGPMDLSKLGALAGQLGIPSVPAVPGGR